MHQIELYFVVFTSFLCCHVVTCPFLLWAASTLAVLAIWPNPNALLLALH